MASRFIVITVLLLASFLHAPAAGNSWMPSLNGTLPISQYSIPGTHDSGARFDPALAPGTAKCQDLTIAQQLDAGVRFLDIRCRHIDDGFTIHHGEVYQNINFNNVLERGPPRGVRNLRRRGCCHRRGGFLWAAWRDFGRTGRALTRMLVAGCPPDGYVKKRHLCRFWGGGFWLQLSGRLSNSRYELVPARIPNLETFCATP